MIKKLIVNADDFGLHESINESVEIAHKNGILTSASLSVNGDSFLHAVGIAKRNVKLGVGIHITLTGERPLGRVKKISSLIDTDGRLPKKYIDLCMKIFRRKISLDHVAAECEAQIVRFLESGLTPTHIDSHQHLHFFPPIFKVLDPILRKYGIKRIRTLNVPWFDYRKVDILKMGFALFTKFSRLLKDTGYKSPDHLLGFFKSGDMDIDYLANILPMVKPGVTEIVFHPGTENRLLEEKYGFWKEHYGWPCDWAREYNLLLDPGIKRIVELNNMALINYSDI